MISEPSFREHAVKLDMMPSFLGTVPRGGGGVARHSSWAGRGPQDGALRLRAVRTPHCKEVPAGGEGPGRGNLDTAGPESKVLRAEVREGPQGAAHPPPLAFQQHGRHLGAPGYRQPQPCALELWVSPAWAPAMQPTASLASLAGATIPGLWTQQPAAALTLLLQHGSWQVSTGGPHRVDRAGMEPDPFKVPSTPRSDLGGLGLCPPSPETEPHPFPSGPTRSTLAPPQL